MVYVITDCCGAVKIGHTQNMHQRMLTLQTSAHKELIALMTIETGSKNEDRRLEKALHTHFRTKRIVLQNGHITEWFEDSIFEKISNTDFLSEVFNECRLAGKPIIHFGLPDAIWGDVVRERTKRLSNVNLYEETENERVKAFRKSEKAHLFRSRNITLQT
jgi:hypothetical protein